MVFAFGVRGIAVELIFNHRLQPLQLVPLNIQVLVPHYHFVAHLHCLLQVTGFGRLPALIRAAPLLALMI